MIARLSVTALLAGLVLLLGTGSPAATPAGATNPPSMDAMSLDMDPEDGDANAALFSPVNTCTPSQGGTQGSCVLGTREPCARVIENDVLDADEDVAPDRLQFDLTALNVPGSVNAMQAFFGDITYPAPHVRIVAKNNAGLLSTANGYTPLTQSDSVPDTDGLYTVDEADLNAAGVSGSGFLMRLTLETTADATPGVYPLRALNFMHGDLESNYSTPDAFNHGLLVIGSGPFPDCTDADGDGYPGGIDNCPALANPAQTDTDNDGMGNACDTDDDGDLVYDVDEAACGSDPLLASRRPERIDGVFSGVSDDGDAEVDEPLPAGSEAFDCDGDGYLGSEENNVYQPSTRGDQDACGTNSSPPTVPASPIGWPADLSPASPNRVTLADVTSFIVPVRYFNTNVGANPGDVRWDLKAGKSGFTYDINLNDITGLTTRKPAMLGGNIRSFNGPPCPWLP